MSRARSSSLRLAWCLALAACGGTQHPTETPIEEAPPTVSSDAGTDAATVDATEVEDAAEVSESTALDADAGPAIVDTTADAATVDDAAHDAQIARGRRVYDRVCETCHSDGPRIVGRHLGEVRVRRQVREGGTRMRAIPVGRLSEADLDAICAFLGGR